MKEGEGEGLSELGFLGLCLLAGFWGGRKSAGQSATSVVVSPAAWSRRRTMRKGAGMGASSELGLVGLGYGL